MTGLPPPEAFSFKPEQWPDWSANFRRYRHAAKLHNEQGIVQRDTLLYIMGRDAEKVYKTFVFAEREVGEGDDMRIEREDETDFERIMTKFDQYFLVKRNIIYERYMVKVNQCMSFK